MTKLISKIEEIIKMPKVYHGKKSSGKEIQKAMEKLNIVFPEDYFEYLKNYGVISFYATEWTGLGIKGRLNVVEATLEERKLNPEFPKNLFVVENLAIEGIVIAADEQGQVYEIQGDKQNKICDSLVEYLDECIKRKK